MEDYDKLKEVIDVEGSSSNGAEAKTMEEQGIKPWLKSLFSGDVQAQNGAPWWLCWLCALSLILLLNQIQLPIFKGRIALGDLAFLVSFLPMFAWVLIKRRSLYYPLLGIAVLVVFCLVNLVSASGLSGVIESAQVIQYLLCGVLLFSFMLEHSPKLTAFAVTCALVLNVALAFFQAGKYGIDSILAPADVLKVSWGFGEAFTGFFRSRMALSFFVSTALVWLYPQIIGKHNSRFRTFVAVLIAVPCLLSIVNGQMLLITVPILIAEGFIYSRRVGFASVLAVVLALSISLAWEKHGQTVLTTLNPVKSGAYAGELKTNHIDFIAAMKMASSKPWFGIGSGRYQGKIGTFYGELPNPAYNDIATDTQASWGILAGTTGFVTAVLLALLLLSCCGKGVHRYICQYGTNQLALGGSAALVVIFLGMFISDPLIRGLCWMLALALASVIVPQKDEVISSKSLSSGVIIVIGIVLAGLLLANAFTRKICASCESRKAEKTEVAPAAKAAEPVAPASKPIAVPMMVSKLYKVVNADSVLEMTSPFQSTAVQGTASSKVLEVLDNAGKPPEGKEPAMEYGGAVFKTEVPADGQYKVWLNVWWEGSCGNTINLQMDEEKKSVTAGNDSNYLAWHWVSIPRVYDLTAGEHKLTILNREDGIKLDQILITNDMNYTPSGIEK